MKSFVLFNDKGGVGKTTLTFNIAHMMVREGWRVVVLDYDPQCSLSTLFLEDEALMDCWQADPGEGATVAACLDPVRRGKGEVLPPRLLEVEGAPGLWLLPGHLSLSRFEQTLAEQWPRTMAIDNERALDVTTALDLLSKLAAERVNADMLMIDVGSSLGALNRAALLACDHVIVPLVPDLFSLQGLENVGPTLREWRTDWQTVRSRHMEERSQASLPAHEFLPLGYIVQQPVERVERPASAHAGWAEKIPELFHEKVLGTPLSQPSSMDRDPYCLARIKHFASLVPFAQQARKPLFDLRRADGISGGGQSQAVASCRTVFKNLVSDIATRAGVPRPSQ